MVKCGEILLEGLKGDEVCGNSVGLSMKTVLRKLLVTFGQIFGVCLI